MGLKKDVLRCLQESGGKMKIKKLFKTVDEDDDRLIEEVIEKLKNKEEITCDGKYLIIMGHEDEKEEKKEKREKEGKKEKKEKKEEEDLVKPIDVPSSSSSVIERYNEASKIILNKQQGLCSHGKKYLKCRKCRDEVGGIESDDVFFCIHGKRRDRCKEKGCGGKAFCIHGRRKMDCKQCGGSRICPHGHVKRFCKDCGGAGLCIHQKRVYLCRICKKEKRRSCSSNGDGSKNENR